MDYQRFLQQLPHCYDNWQQDTVRPKAAKFQQVRDRIQGMTTVNVMQLLNCAVGWLEANELYCEIGTYQGTTLIGALLDHPDRMAYAVDNFSEFDPDGQSFAALMQNLEQFGLSEQVYFCNQDFQQFWLELQELNTEDKIGVYFYDGAHDYRSTLLGLLLAKPFLSDRALILLDDANWGTVQQACWDFLATSPEARIELELRTPVARFPTFWNGIQVLSWDRSRAPSYSAAIFVEQRRNEVIKAIYNLQLLEQREEAIAVLLKEATYAHQQEQFGLAEKKYREYLLWNELDHEAWTQLGVLLYQMEAYQESYKSLSKALELNSENSQTYYYLGNTFTKLEQISLAIAAYQQAIQLDPKRLDSYNNLGLLLTQLRQLEAAEAVYRQAIAIEPAFPGTYLNLGNLLLERAEITAAISTYQAILELTPAHADVQPALTYALEAQADPIPFYQSFGHYFFEQQDYATAIRHYRRYLDLQAGTVDVYLELNQALWQMGEQSEAIAILRQAIDHHPASEPLYFELILKLTRHGDTKESIHVAEIACQALPHSYTLRLVKGLTLPYIYDSIEEIEFYRDRYLAELQNLLDTTSLETPEQRQQALTGISRFASFYITYQAQSMLEPQQMFGQLVHRIMAANFPHWVQPLPLPPVTDKIRVGFLTHYFHAYSGTLWLTGWLRHLDRTQFEIYCYYIGNQPDSTTQEFQQFSNTFRHIPGDIESIATQVLQDQLHILVFPEIGMDPQTVQLAALRLAPVQCTAWGHPVTSGLPTIDYYLSSEFMEPPDGQNHYTETLVRLPRLGIAYPQPLVPALAKPRAAFGLREDAIVYFCGQAPFKYLPQHDELLVRIAQQVPTAQFVFLRADVLQNRLQRAFASAGLQATQYCLFWPALPRADYLLLNQLCDGFLDTIGFTGGNTTMDAIACGLPVITYPQAFMRGRMSYGILQALGITETVATSEAHYIELAVKIGCDRDWRNNLSKRMIAAQRQVFDDQAWMLALATFWREVTVEAIDQTIS